MISTEDVTQWVVIHNVDAVNLTNLDSLQQNWQADSTREPILKKLKMSIDFTLLSSNHNMEVNLPGPCELVSKPVIKNNSYIGHRFGIKYIQKYWRPEISSNLIRRHQPFEFWYQINWDDDAITQAENLKDMVFEHFTAERIKWSGPRGILARRSTGSMQKVNAMLSNLNMSLPEHKDNNPDGISAIDWKQHQFDLWWYGYSLTKLNVAKDSPLALADVDGPDFLNLRKEVSFSLSTKGTFGYQSSVHTSYNWLNPGYVLLQSLSDEDKQTALNLKIVRNSEDAFMIGRIPEDVSELTPYCVIGNDSRPWRLYLPNPNNLYHGGLSFTSWDSLYFAHNGNNAEIVLNGAGITNAITASYASGESSIILNRDIRPTHPSYRKRTQPRKTTPLELSINVAGTSPKSISIEQDEPDIIRQEFGFHMNWQKEGNIFYYQNAKGQGIASNSHQQAGDSPHLKIPQPTGDSFQMQIPKRDHLRIMRPKEVRFYRNKVSRNSRAKYKYTLLHEKWGDWLEQVELEYQDVRGAIISNPNDVSISGFEYISHFIDRYNDGATLNLVEYLPEHLQVSSSWRPPQHNENVGGAYASFHQSGLALDVQPAGTGPNRRRPIAMAVLHFVTSNLIGEGGLRTALLEKGGSLFVFGSYNDSYRDYQIGEKTENGRKRFRMFEKVGNDEQGAMICEEAEEETFDVRASGGMRKNLINRYIVDVLGFPSSDISVDWDAFPEQNKYSDIYWHGLNYASHMHIDFYRPPLSG